MSNLLIRQQFFMNFWLQRNNADPEGAWNSYHQVVEAVNREFSTSTRKGYETDRGRIYLQYGAPNQRIVEHITPQSYPYEIWHYYKFQNQSNLKFVFYARDRSVNDHLLVHSTAYGEVKNVNWQYEVQRNIHPHDTEKERYTRAMEEDEFGEHTGEYYNLQK
jgi:GWxTD domain-containing protein